MVKNVYITYECTFKYTVCFVKKNSVSYMLKFNYAKKNYNNNINKVMLKVPVTSMAIFYLCFIRAT
jgi:hypothetical protein